MEIFFNHLAAKLDHEKPNWREDTIVLMDNAAYHRSESVMKVYKRLRIPVMFFGAHSYNVAPVELFFALFKSIDINPRHLPLGKK